MTLMIVLQFIKRYWKYVSIGVVCLVLFFAIVSRSCGGKREVKIDQETVNKINSADRKEYEKALEKVVTENRDVIETVEQRNVNIAQEIQKANAAIVESKRQGKDVTAEELEALLLGNK